MTVLQTVYTSWLFFLWIIILRMDGIGDKI